MNNANSLKALKTTNFKDKEVSKLQDNVAVALQPILNCNVIDGVLLRNIRLRPLIRNEVLHKLNREPLGFLIVRQRADSRIWDLQDSNNNKGQYITLACSHEVYVDVWVF